MDILKNLFGDPVPTGVTLVLLTILLVIVLLVVVWVFRKFVGSPSIKAVRGRQPRLAVTDAANLDDKRRLVLVRRDDVEHLVMIGGASDVLIESNIVRAMPRAPLSTISEGLDPVSQPDESEIAPAVGMGAIAATAVANSDLEDATTRLAASVENYSEIDLSKTDENEMTTVEEIKETALSELSTPLDETTTSIEANISTTENIGSEEIEPEALASLENALGSELIDDTSHLSADTTETVATIESAPSAPKLDSHEASTASVDESTNMEDEMQKLLDELSGEKA